MISIFIRTDGSFLSRFFAVEGFWVEERISLNAHTLLCRPIWEVSHRFLDSIGSADSLGRRMYIMPCSTMLGAEREVGL